MKRNHQKLGVGLLALFFIFLVITLLYVNPLVEEQHAPYHIIEQKSFLNMVFI